jgi:hypothetical protein
MRTDRSHKPTLQFTERLTNIATLSLQAISEHHLQVESHFLTGVNKLDRHVWFTQR